MGWSVSFIWFQAFKSAYQSYLKDHFAITRYYLRDFGLLDLVAKLLELFQQYAVPH